MPGAAIFLRRWVRVLALTASLGPSIGTAGCRPSDVSDRQFVPNQSASDTARDNSTANNIIPQVKDVSSFDGQLRRLQASEIKRSIDGRSLSAIIDASNGRTSHISEAFFDGGKWMLGGHRAPIEGRYRIVGDQLCTGLLNESDFRHGCRYVLQGSDGRVFFQSLGPNGALAEPVEMKVVVLNR